MLLRREVSIHTKDCQREEGAYERMVIAIDDSSVEILSKGEGILDTTTFMAELEDC